MLGVLESFTELDDLCPVESGQCMSLGPTCAKPVSLFGCFPVSTESYYFAGFLSIVIGKLTLV